MGLLSSMTNGLVGLPNTKHECDVRIGELEKKLLGFSLGKIVGVRSDEGIKKEIKRLKAHKKTLSK